MTSSDPQTRPELGGHEQLAGVVEVVVGTHGHGPVHATFAKLEIAIF